MEFNVKLLIDKIQKDIKDIEKLIIKYEGNEVQENYYAGKIDAYYKVLDYIREMIEI